jgi:NAD(P)-dependent dehydrogenase (short-subunit alcohol dehydrogenase family)
MDDEIKGKVAIVTGASTPRGIGNAAAKRFAAAGACVFLVAEGTEDQLETAVRECRALTHAGRVESALIDLGQPGAAERMIAQADALFGRVDVLMNNAAIRISEDFGNYTRAQFDLGIAVNLAAPFFASQAVLPILRRQGGGRIINITSQMGHVTFAQKALYGLSKAALIHLTKSMAYELGRENIIVNAISPGPIDTQRSLVRTPELTRELLARLPLGRFGTPEEIADLAFYLAFSSPAFLQGQDIVIDGGYIIH